MYLNKLFYISVVLFFLIPEIKGQDHQTIAKNSFFAEYTLEGPVYSINYDRIFAQSAKINYHFRAGFSVIKNKIAFPVGGGITSGRKNHHAEFSLTVTPLVEKKEVNYGSGSDNDKFIYLFPGAGYRYQKPFGGIFFRAMAGPAIILDPAEGDFWNMDPQVKFSFSVGAGFIF